LNEGNWNSAAKYLEMAMRIHSNQPEYNLAMGECKMQLGEFRDAIQFFSNVVRVRPKNISSWEALIRCLYNAGFFKEALEQVQAAIRITGGKPIFIFYMSAVCFALGKSKEGLLHLEKAMGKAPKLLKKMVELNPAILQYQSVVDVIARYKKSKSF
jgi:tetratricopeptide (TPR) repeat protein